MVALQVKIISLDIGLSSVNDILLAGGLMDRIKFDHFCMFLMSQRESTLTQAVEHCGNKLGRAVYMRVYNNYSKHYPEIQ